MKTKTILLFTMTFLIALTACAKDADEFINGDIHGVDASESVINEPPIVIIEDTTPPDDNLPISFLTGELKDKDIVNRRPLAVQLVNSEFNLPHYGISQASIIYEAPVEGRVTRLLAFFEDYDDLERIGPVRGSRDYFIYEAMSKDAIFSHWGLTPIYCGHLINSDKVDNLSPTLYGVDVGVDIAYRRYERPGYPVEATGYLYIKELETALEILGYRRNYSDSFVPQFTFASGDTFAEYSDYPAVAKIYPGGGMDLDYQQDEYADQNIRNLGGYGHLNNPMFEYNPVDKLYYRYQFGDKMIDELNGEQLTFSNVIFQYVHGEVRDLNDYLTFQVHGSGEAKIFTAGKKINGTWSRYGGDLTPAKFYDDNGNEIVLNRGKTWICLIWDEYAEYAVYE